MPSILESPAVREAAMPVTVEQYRRLTDEGIIVEKTELIRGVILKKMGKSPLHTWIVQFLVEQLRSAIGSGFHIRQEQPMTLSDSEPEPDIAVVSGAPSDYRLAHPQSAVLIVEVAVSTEELDHQKALLYAEADIPEYWLVLANQQQILVHSEPSESGYTSRNTVGMGESLNPKGHPEASIRVDALFA